MPRDVDFPRRELNQMPNMLRHTVPVQKMRVPRSVRLRLRRQGRASQVRWT